MSSIVITPVTYLMQLDVQHNQTAMTEVVSGVAVGTALGRGPWRISQSQSKLTGHKS